MRLKLIKHGCWKIVAPMDGNGCCALEDQLIEQMADPKLKGYAVGFFALWDRIPPVGPRHLSTALYHCVDEAHGIYEFIKGPCRLLCFEAEGALVVCSHLLRKKSQKIRTQDKAPAIALRAEFLRAHAANTIELIEDKEG